jgi:hypothetical protein
MKSINLLQGDSVKDSFKDKLELISIKRRATHYKYYRN